MKITLLAALMFSLIAFSLQAYAKEFVVAQYELPSCMTTTWREIAVFPFGAIRQPEIRMQRQFATVRLVVDGKNVENPEFDEPLRSCGSQVASQLSLVGTTTNSPEIQRVYADSFRQCVSKRAKSIDIQSIYLKTDTECR